MLPIYCIFLFAISNKDPAFGGKRWPNHATLRNFAIVFDQENHFLNHFWLQM